MYDESKWQSQSWDDGAWKVDDSSLMGHQPPLVPPMGGGMGSNLGMGGAMGSLPGMGTDLFGRGGSDSGWGDKDGTWSRGGSGWSAPGPEWGAQSVPGADNAVISEKAGVLLIGAKLNYLMTSVKERLADTKLTVFTSIGSIDSVDKKAIEESRAIVIYADATLVADQTLLIYLKDVVVEKELAVFVIGSVDELAEVRNYIPKHMINEEFERPVNVRDVAEKVEDYVMSNARVEKKKILVVDDSSVMLHSLKEWLGGKYQVSLADSGIAGIMNMVKNKPDLVLLDYEMPICDGKVVFQMLRSQLDFADIPVIFLTGKGDRESVLEVMMLKPDGYLLKSMKPFEIIQAVDDFFAKQKTNEMHRQ